MANQHLLLSKYGFSWKHLQSDSLEISQQVLLNLAF